MSKRARKKPASQGLQGNGRSNDSVGLNGGSTENWKTTGRTLVLFREGTGTASIKTLRNVAGLSVANAADFEGGAAPADNFGGADGMVYPDLGVAVVDMPPQQIHAAAATESSDILAVEPERIVHAIEDGLGYDTYQPMARAGTQAGPPLDFLRGYRDAVNHLYDKLTGNGAAELLAEGLAPVFGETEVTWGLQATKAAASRFTGRDIRVAVLDTGLDPGHPDFVGRRITTQSFIQGESAQDGHGHGTHCVGTACGSRLPGELPRYGVAFEAEIFAGKVLSNQGSGGDGGILAGIQWAITNRCAVVSMSLGAATQVGQPFSTVFNEVGNRALAAGTLIIAAAGNESERPQLIAPVGHPANCPSIMAVAAVDRHFRIARFSCGGLNPQGGQVDIAGPGVEIRSTWLRPTLYRTIDGTSMATPHVAGIAALFAQANANHRGRVLMSILTQSAHRLTLPGRDVGAGLVQAP